MTNRHPVCHGLERDMVTIRRGLKQGELISFALGGEQSEDFRPALIRPEGTALSKPRARQGEFHEPCRCPGFQVSTHVSPEGTALIRHRAAPVVWAESAGR